MGLISRVSSRTYRCFMNLELFFKNLPELRNILTKYAELRPTGINLPNKYGLNGKYYRDCVNELIRHPSKLRPIIHYSLQYESVQGKNVNNSQTYEKFVDFLNTFGSGIKSSNGEILLVSGTRKNPHFDSTACLEKLSADLEKMKQCDNLEFSSTNIANLDLSNFPDLNDVHKSDRKCSRGSNFGKTKANLHPHQDRNMRYAKYLEESSRFNLDP